MWCSCGDCDHDVDITLAEQMRRVTASLNDFGNTLVLIIVLTGLMGDVLQIDDIGL
jgi:hypothetical protein